MAVAFRLLALHLLCVGLPAVADGLTAYQVLESYNFPVGLLPEGVTSYELDSSTGKFTVHLGETSNCDFSLDAGYQLRYKSTITGIISSNRLYNLKGVSVKILLFYVNIVEVLRSDEELAFSVRILSASFAIDSFLESPRCGCGLDCVNVHKGIAFPEEEGPLSF